MITCKRVYDDALKQDGYRILVDRLWPRGIKKSDLVHDEWNKTLAPSNALRKAFHSEAIDFSEFTRQYREELMAQQDALHKVAERARAGNVTLLYAAKNTTQNHARVLADVLNEIAR
ncbi:DUF488 family protein [Atlantibacter subterranea]|uniref:DUF488 family protein n=1 Tax=Atlantibacter subterraneus TaxID=255519 RepID=A0ABU4E3Q9_9ENTR|nr:DUF488 family protein [Atlantibacter subterranea]MDV7023758.1 DUF488 family protein [Atlantibacter subterranea]MDZ5666854.1 DUF488 family protein [Atlantibacter hermannii]